MAEGYIALIRKEAASDYGVEFPDLPGCVTAGATLEEAAAMAREALALHLEGLAAEGAPRPEPSALESIMARARSRGAAAILVPAPRSRARARRINVTLDERLLAEIDAAAGPGERSGFLARAARAALRAPAAAKRKRAKTERAAKAKPKGTAPAKQSPKRRRRG